MKTQKNHNKKSQELMVIDIGNTTAAYAVYQSRSLKHEGSILTANIPNKANFFNKSGVNRVNLVIISSVVPEKSKKLANLIRKKQPKTRVFEVGKQIKLKIPMDYNPKKLGIDRLVNIYGAIKLYPLPICIIDFGTAITFDYVSKCGTFKGGVIVPGIQTSHEALSQRAALIPKLSKIKPVKNLLGRDTESAFSSGLLNGFGALADGLVERMKRQFGKPMKVLATGGFAKEIAPYTKSFDYVDPLHTLKSLAEIYWNEIGGNG